MTQDELAALFDLDGDDEDDKRKKKKKKGKGKKGAAEEPAAEDGDAKGCLLYTSPSPRD